MFRFYTLTDELSKTSKIYRYELLQTENIFDLIYKGDIKAVKVKIINGTSVNLRNDKEQTLLHYAILYNQVEIAKHLLSLGASLDTIDSSGVAVRDLIRNRNLELYNHLDEYKALSINIHLEHDIIPHQAEKLGVCDDCYCCYIM